MKRIVFIVLIAGWCFSCVFLFYWLARLLYLAYFDFGFDYVFGLVTFFFTGFFVRTEFPLFLIRLKKYLVELFNDSVYS